MIEKIVSGGQTGVDRAALDVALERGIHCGGWCPKHRRAEDGRIADRYPLMEAESANYAARTALNVRDSDGTLILTTGPLTTGTALTRNLAVRYGRPVLVINLTEEHGVEPVEQWLSNNRIRTLNVAGPRESSQPGIHAQAVAFLTSWLNQTPGTSSQPKRRRRSTKRA